MRVNATLLLAATSMAAFVEADAFVTPSARAPSTISKHHGQQAKMPKLASSSSSSWSKTALEMSGGGGSGEAVATEGTATIPDEVFNLVKSIVGAGVLSLPAGESFYSIAIN